MDQLWQRLGIAECLKGLLSKRGYEIPVERSILAMVTNRVVDPASKLTSEHWVNNEACIPELPSVSVHQLYRRMDFLLEHDVAIQENIFFSVANLLNLEVELIYFDTTSTYFEIDGPDEAEEEDDDYTLRQHGHTKDHRPDLPQVVIGMAVTKEGIPVRCWVFSGETSDMSMVEQVKKDLNGWRLGRVMFVMDCGFSSEENCVKLQMGGGHYIVGEKMRSGKPEVEAALSKRGRYTMIKEDLYAKEAVIGEGERRKRFAIVLNRKAAAKDRLTREKHLNHIAESLAAHGASNKKEHTKALCALASHPVYGRYLKAGPDGKFKIAKRKVAAEERLDGKFLLKTSDDTLSLHDIVLGYKQLYDIQRGFRTLKTDLELRPVYSQSISICIISKLNTHGIVRLSVKKIRQIKSDRLYHRTSDRIKAHVLLCWLSLLLIRIVEIDTGMTWFHVRRLLKQIHLVSLQLPDGIVHQSTALSDDLLALFRACHVKPPPKFVQMIPSCSPSQ
jgi:transposase